MNLTRHKESSVLRTDDTKNLKNVERICMDNLSDLKIGDVVKISSIDCNIKLKHRLMYMGMVRNTVVQLTKVSPFGTSVELFLRGYKLILRKEDARLIKIRMVTKV